MKSMIQEMIAIPSILLSTGIYDAEPFLDNRQVAGTINS
jgi:hypothetical protein